MDKKSAGKILEHIIEIKHIINNLSLKEQEVLLAKACDVVGGYPIYGAVSNIGLEELIIMAFLVDEAIWWRPEVKAFSRP